MQKFLDVLTRWEAGALSQLEAAELIGCSERQFRRYRDRYEDEGLEGLKDRRLGKASGKGIGEIERERMLSLYRLRHGGWTAKHFHDHGRRHHGFNWGYTWTKTQLHLAGLLDRSPRRGAHRRKRERKPCAGMMLHQDGSRHVWLEGQPALDLIVTMDDATSEIYSALLVEEEGTASTFRGLLEVFSAHGLACSLYTDRGSHYFHTCEAGGKVDRDHPTQVGRALERLGIEHIAAYSPEARGRSERMFGTLQGRLAKELALAGIREVVAANLWIKDVYLPSHNALFAKSAALPESAFVSVDDTSILRETLAIEEERIVARDNTVAYEGKRLQIPESRVRAHYVKARVKVREYPEGGLAIFHGPRCIGRYSAAGDLVIAPTPPSMAPCSPPSRRGLETPEPVAWARRRPALTAAPREAEAAPWVGTKKRAARSNQETAAVRTAGKKSAKSRSAVAL
jgi:transposase